jgi:hypothetical protein
MLRPAHQASLNFLCTLATSYFTHFTLNHFPLQSVAMSFLPRMSRFCRGCAVVVVVLPWMWRATPAMLRPAHQDVSDCDVRRLTTTCCTLHTAHCFLRDTTHFTLHIAFLAPLIEIAFHSAICQCLSCPTTLAIISSTEKCAVRCLKWGAPHHPCCGRLIRHVCWCCSQMFTPDVGCFESYAWSLGPLFYGVGSKLHD